MDKYLTQKPVGNYIHGSSAPEQDRLGLLNQLTNPAFINFLEIDPGNSVLEIGSGTGILASELAYCHPDCNFRGVEISDSQLQAVKSRPANLDFVKGDVLRLPFEPASFEVVYGRYILEHVSNPAQALDEAFRVLKDQGKIFLQENSIFISQLYPHCPHFDVVWKAFACLQQLAGGDAMIGLKLHALLMNSGFHRIRLSIAPEVHTYGQDSFSMHIINLRENIRGAVQGLIEAKLANQEMIDLAIYELDTLLTQPNASACFYWNRASALKVGV